MLGGGGGEGAVSVGGILLAESRKSRAHWADQCVCELQRSVWFSAGHVIYMTTSGDSGCKLRTEFNV